MELFPHGDETIVGERGISLSGGQKARVSLARAIYKQADIYLLDDPLSAVDSHVGKHIFKECIQKFLAQKTVILVTHQLQFLNNDQHVILMSEGKIQSQGNYKELKETQKDSLLLLSPEESVDDIEKVNKIFEKLSQKVAVQKPMQEEKETFAVGSVGWEVYKRYFAAVKSIPLVVFVLTLKFIVQTIASSGDFLVSQWVNWEETHGEKVRTNLFEDDEKSVLINDTFATNSSEFRMVELEGERKTYVLTYSILIGCLVFFIIQAEYSFFYMCLRASKNLHDFMFRGVSKTVMIFFNNNPSGRILNRFSKDIGNVDTTLPNVLFDCSVVSYFICNYYYFIILGLWTLRLCTN
jgi:ABC-type multidrug transport system fused ATPase/permease subunit